MECSLSPSVDLTNERGKRLRGGDGFRDRELERFDCEHAQGAGIDGRYGAHSRTDERLTSFSEVTR